MNIMNNFHDFIDYVYEDLYQYRPIKRYLRDAANPLEYFDDVEFQRRFRFRKDTIVNVLLPLLNLTQSANNRGLPIPPLLQLLIAVRFYATGNFQVVCGDLHKLSQAVISRIVTRISKVLALKVGVYVKFPNVEERSEIKRKFYQRAGFPGIVGTIDCTHVPIKNPRRENGEVYRNRKGFFSINVQIVCGPHMEIYDIVARWPGSVHDSRIFTNSRCKMRFEEGDLKNSGILLGDSGYAQTSYMFTPILNPQTSPQQRYNRSHISTRNIIERVNGVLKRRFACLSRKLQNKITTVPNIIVSCAILHNISIQTNEELPEPLREPEIALPVVQENERGSIIRNNFIIRHFT